MESASLGRMSSMGSRRSSISQSESGRWTIGGASSEFEAQTGGGDRIIKSELLGRSSLSSRKSSLSLSRDVGERIRDSFSFSRDIADQIIGDVDGSVIAQAGDSGDRVVEDNRQEENEAAVEIENGVVKLSDDAFMVATKCRSRGASNQSHVSSAVEENLEVVSSLPTDSIIHSSSVRDQVQERNNLDKQHQLPKQLDYISYILHLAVFGILGVFTRYLLQKLFGPNLLALTGDNTPLYLDLPSNMLGSFLMGWFGIVFKADLRQISEHITVGVTTGYMGSLTTFSGWNQKMLDLASKGHWVFAVGGYVLGMFVVNECMAYGVESAEWTRKFLVHRLSERSQKSVCRIDSWMVNTRKRQLLSMLVMMLLLASLWALSGSLARSKLESATNGAVLWLGCLVGPFGVWCRWYLARLNGQGWGKRENFKWLPTGTLLANVLAACIMAALSTISKEVGKRKFGLIMTGFQFGFLGCLSTVSTFVAEVYAMRQSGHHGRAFAYILLTILPSFCLGTLVFSLPVWTKHYS